LHFNKKKVSGTNKRSLPENYNHKWSSASVVMLHVGERTV